MHLYLITVLIKVIAIVFVFENFIVFVIVFKYYAMYLDPSLLSSRQVNQLAQAVVAEKQGQQAILAIDADMPRPPPERPIIVH